MGSPTVKESFLREEEYAVRRRALWTLAVLVALNLVPIPANLYLARRDYKQCAFNLKIIGAACYVYSTDFYVFPKHPSSLARPTFLKAYPTCPAAGRDTYTFGYVSATDPDNFTVVCAGHNHGNWGLPPNYPQYTGTDGLRLAP